MILISAIISVLLALVLYSTSVISELVAGELKKKNIILFGFGFFFDFTGTILMSSISKGFSLNFHSILGLTALALMGVKLAWSFLKFRNQNGVPVPKFFTMFVWFLWLIVFFGGFFVR